MAPIITEDCGHKENEECMNCSVCGKCSESLNDEDVCSSCSE